MTHESNDDIELRGIAMAAFDAHERTVSPAETEAALHAVRSRLDAGDMGDSSPVFFDEVGARRRRSPALLLGAAAAVVGMVSLGLVAVVGGGSSPDVAAPVELLPPTDAEPSDAAATTLSAEPTSSPADDAGEIAADPSGEDASTDSSPSNAAEGEDVPATTVGPADSASGGTLVSKAVEVDAAEPPTLLEPLAFATVPLIENVNGNQYSVGIGSDVVAVFQPDTSFLSLVDSETGAVEQIEIDDRLGDVIIGPGPVAYGFGDVVIPEPGEPQPGPLPIVAIALSGERQGEVVARELLDLTTWLEHPRSPIGHGPDGVVARVRQTNETLIEYVDELGNPLEWTEAEPPLLTFERDSAGGVVSTLDGMTWRLDVTPSAGTGDPYILPSAPAPTSGGRVLYTERIGDDLTPADDFGNNAMPALAVLESDGSGNWFRLPDDWDVVASDIWGTVLARTVGTTIELALLDDVLPVAAGDSDSTGSDASDPEPVVVEPPLNIRAGTAAAATSEGVFLADATNTWTNQVLADQSGGLALPVNGLLVYQAADSNGLDRQGAPIQVVDNGEISEFSDGDKRLTLLDVGRIDGRAVLLAASVTAMPAGPDDTDSRLLLVDALTLEATDLGVFGGWEDSVVEGRFVDGAIALLRSQSADFTIEIIEYDGTQRSSTALAADRTYSLLDFDAAVWAVEPRFVGDDFAPVLFIRKVDVATGELVSVELALVLDGVEVPAGFCDTADFLDGRIVCDQSAGPPISIALVNGATIAVPGLDDGAVRFRASQ